MVFRAAFYAKRERPAWLFPEKSKRCGGFAGRIRVVLGTGCLDLAVSAPILDNFSALSVMRHLRPKDPD